MDPKDRIPHDDWADQDLLTRAEAAERLAVEINEIQAEVVAGNADEVMLRRLAALREAHAQMSGSGGAG
jgi:hypothetical protein